VKKKISPVETCALMGPRCWQGLFVPIIKVSKLSYHLVSPTLFKRNQGKFEFKLLIMGSSTTIFSRLLFLLFKEPAPSLIVDFRRQNEIISFKKRFFSARKTFPMRSFTVYVTFFLWALTFSMQEIDQFNIK
jgi:hypothetical protein